MARILDVNHDADKKTFDMISELSNTQAETDIASHVLYLTAESYVIAALPHLDVSLPDGRSRAERRDVVSALTCIAASHFLNAAGLGQTKQQISAEAIGDVRVEYESVAGAGMSIEARADWIKKQGDLILVRLGGSLDAPDSASRHRWFAGNTTSQLLI